MLVSKLERLEHMTLKQLRGGLYKLWRHCFAGACHAGDNQIDQPLLDLLQQNIAAAKAGGQNDAATFMEKVHDAARKFIMSK